MQTDFIAYNCSLQEWDTTQNTRFSLSWLFSCCFWPLGRNVDKGSLTIGPMLQTRSQKSLSSLAIVLYQHSGLGKHL